MTQQHNHDILLHVLKETQSQVSRGQIPSLVFDLDSTLFEVTPRSQKILNEFVESELITSHVEIQKALKEIKLIISDHGLEGAIRRSGLSIEDEELRKKLIHFWRERFFSNDYLSLDQPFAGAVDYVNELYNLGGHIFYLTGRDVHRMGVGTPRELARWGFPVNKSRATLLMKPQKGLDDSEFKLDELRKITNLLCFFENEPKIIHHVEAELPNLRIVFFESSHSGKAEPKSEWLRICHFVRSK